MWNFESATVKKYFGKNLKKAKANHDKELKKQRTSLSKSTPTQSCQSLNFGSTSRKLVTSPARRILCTKETGKPKEPDLTTLRGELGNIVGT